MTAPQELLHPRPKRLAHGDGWVTLGRLGEPHGELASPRVAARADTLLDAPDVEATPFPTRLERHSDLPSEGYRLRLERHSVTVEAASDAGALWALETLAQWIRLAGEGGENGIRVPTVTIDDAPDLPVRGVLLDVSRDKVPTIATLESLIDQLASWKINQLQLYFEHTFAYPGHEEVWRDASPLTADEVTALDERCRQRGIELVANQNSFGHFHRWLRHARYRPLAECPQGIEHPFSDRPEPFSLCAIDPRALALLAELYDHLLPCFASATVNVGLDETFDLGRGRSAAACAERGRHRVYLDYVLGVHGLLAERGRRMQMWADILLEGPPELTRELPSDVVPIAWGYEANHPFEEQARRLAESGHRFLLCPGTSSWLSFAGRATNALANLGNAAQAATDHAAEGLLVADWGDHGHLQPLAVSFLGFLAGAACGWNARIDPASLPWAELLDVHAFHGQPGVGQCALALADLYHQSGTRNRNGSALFHLLTFPHQDLSHPRYVGLSATGLESIHRSAEALREELGGESTERRELRWVATLVSLAARVGRARLTAGSTAPLATIPQAARFRLAATLHQVIAEHGDLWRLRNRPGGQVDSVHRLQRTLEILRPR